MAGIMGRMRPLKCELVYPHPSAQNNASVLTASLSMSLWVSFSVYVQLGFYLVWEIRYGNPATVFVKLRGL